MKLILPDGKTIDLPGATFLETGRNIHHFYDKEGEGRRWLYSISATTPFVLITEAMPSELNADAALEYVAEHLSEYRDDKYRNDLRYIRWKLWNDYSARHGWKNQEDTAEKEGQP